MRTMHMNWVTAVMAIATLIALTACGSEVSTEQPQSGTSTQTTTAPAQQGETPDTTRVTEPTSESTSPQGTSRQPTATPEQEPEPTATQAPTHTPTPTPEPKPELSSISIGGMSGWGSSSCVLKTDGSVACRIQKYSQATLSSRTPEEIGFPTFEGPYKKITAYRTFRAGGGKTDNEYVMCGITLEGSYQCGKWCLASTTFAGSVDYSCRFTSCF